MKKLIFLIIIGVLLLSACGKDAAPAPTQPETKPAPIETQPTTQPTTPPDPREPLLGNWQYHTTVDGNLMALPDFDGTVAYPLVWSFYKDGTAAVMEDRQAYITAISEFENKLIDFLVDSRYQLFVSECHYQGRYDAYIEEEWVTKGMGEQVRQEMTDSVIALQLSTRCAPQRFLGKFTMEEDVITLTDEQGVSYPFSFSLSDEALILSPMEGNTLLETLELPQPLILLP